MYQLIQTAPLRWPDPKKHGISISEQAKDLISRLLEKDRKKRLGQKGDLDEVLGHEFFKGVDHDALLKRMVKAEFIPTVDESGINNFDEDITRQMAEESIIPQEAMAKIKQAEENFNDFGFSQHKE